MITLKVIIKWGPKTMCSWFYSKVVDTTAKKDYTFQLNAQSRRGEIII